MLVIDAVVGDLKSEIDWALAAVPAVAVHRRRVAGGSVLGSVLSFVDGNDRILGDTLA